MREKILEILSDIRPDVDFENEESLVDGGILASFDIISIVTELSDEFEVSIGPKEIVAANFNSLDALTSMLEKLQNE